MVDGHLSQERPDLTPTRRRQEVQPGVRLAGGQCRVERRECQPGGPAHPGAGRQDSAGEPGREQRSQLGPHRGRVAGQASREDDRRALGRVPDQREGREQSSRGALDDGVRLRVTGPVGGSDQRGERRELDTWPRVHHLDHPGVLTVESRPLSVQLAQDALDQRARRCPGVQGPQGGADGLASQPEPRAVVAEQPTVTVRGPGQPVVGERPRRGAGACDQHGAVGRRCAAREGHLEVGDVAGVAGQAGVGPHPVEVRGHCRSSQRRAPRDADHRCLHPRGVETGQCGAQGVAERRCSTGRIGRRVAAAGDAAAVLATVRSHHDDARRRAAEVAAEGQELREHNDSVSNGCRLVSHRSAPADVHQTDPRRASRGPVTGGHG